MPSAMPTSCYAIIPESATSLVAVKEVAVQRSPATREATPRKLTAAPAARLVGR